MLGRAPRTVLGVLVARFRSVSGRRGSCPWSGDTGTGFLAPWGARSGLGGPMPATITPVVAGRCRPSPDRVPEGAPADRDARGIVTAGFTGAAGEGLLPVLRAPHAGVGGIDRHDRKSRLCRHGDDAGAEPPRGHCGDQLPETALAAVFLAGLLRREVQILDRDGLHTGMLGPGDQSGQGVPDLCVPVGRGAGEVVEEAPGVADRVAVGVEAPGGKMVGVSCPPRPHRAPARRSAGPSGRRGAARRRSGTSVPGSRRGGCGRPPPGWR